jgi:hypothetical protein
MEYTVALGSDTVSDQFGLSDLLPVTVIFDRAGKQIKRFDGIVSEADLQSIVGRAIAGGADPLVRAGPPGPATRP